jgi:predicted transcriptional regulator
MGEADYGTLPVVNADGRLVGIITDRDICLAVALTNRNAISIAVHEVMTPKVVSALEDDDVRSALTVMKRSRVRRLPVRDVAGRLRGMLSIEDIVVRGLQGNGVSTADVVDALHAMYVRAPAASEPAQAESQYTPG